MRALLRLACFTFASLGLSLLFLLAIPFTLGRPQDRRSLRAWTLGSWARAGLACAGVDLEVRGRPPDGPGLLVANHVAYLDTWVLAAATRCTFVANAGIARWPFFGFMARAIGILFIDRERKREIPEVNARVEAALREGRLVALFPEATTSSGAGVNRFRPSLLEPAASGGHPVAWATIHYATDPPDPPASAAVCWADRSPLPEHARKLVRLRRVRATLTFGAEPVRGRDRKLLAEELHRRVSSAFEPIA